MQRQVFVLLIAALALTAKSVTAQTPVETEYLARFGPGATSTQASKTPPSPTKLAPPSNLQIVAAEVRALPDWKLAIEWCRGNVNGSVDCPDKYLAYAPHCISSGGRSCLITEARTTAKGWEQNPNFYPRACDRAVALAAACQCHNPNAERSITSTRDVDVCHYLAK